MSLTAEAADFVARIVDDVEEIATLPEVTARIIAVVNDPTSSPSDLHDIIKHDPALVARVLKMVNSAFFARANTIESVEHAIVLLGFDTIHNISVAATMGKLFKSTPVCEGFTARDLWTHSVCVAMTARELANRVSRTHADEAFLGGLLHDVGMLIALGAYPRKLASVCDKSRTDIRRFVDIEAHVVGIDHQQLGLELATRWGFPEAIREVVEHHHTPAEASPAFATITALVHTADVICCQQGQGFNLTGLRETLDDQAMVDEQTIESIRVDLEAICQPGIEMFAR